MSLPTPSKNGTCLVTGASSGIGADIARELARRGYNVTLAARRTDRLSDLAREIADEFNVEAIAIACDATDDAQVDALFDQLAGAGKHIDILVNNAGIGSEGRFHECSYRSQVGQVELNCRAVVGLSHRVLGEMVERGQGGILITASTAAFQPMPRQTVYAATKAFVLSFGEALHQEYSRDGVVVTTLCPGPTKTEFFGEKMDGYIQKTPDIAWQSAAEVAAAGVDGLMRNKRVVIPSIINRLTALSGTFSPHFLSLRMVDKFWPVGKE